MPNVYTTEITSENITSDNPIHQRLFKAYVIAKEYISGNLLEIGCGEGRGIDTLMPHSTKFTAVDKIESVITDLQKKYPEANFKSMNLPPLSGIDDDTFDSIVSFQVIEHIQDDFLYLKEIHRVLRTGGVALITTPNRKMSLSRNPWHIREYLPGELKSLAAKIFADVNLFGISGDDKVMKYHEENRKSVERITKWDIFDLQHRLPASILRLPYEILNRWNRNKLQTKDNRLVSTITHQNFFVDKNPTNALDLLLIVRK